MNGEPARQQSGDSSGSPGSENGFQRRKRRKRSQILQAALQLFERHGFRRVSIADIASHARVSQVTIYNHFGSKESLIREVLRTFLEARLERYRKIIAGSLPYREKLRSIVTDKAALIDQFRGELITAVYRLRACQAEDSQYHNQCSQHQGSPGAPAPVTPPRPAEVDKVGQEYCARQEKRTRKSHVRDGTLPRW